MGWAATGATAAEEAELQAPTRVSTLYSGDFQLDAVGTDGNSVHVYMYEDQGDHMYWNKGDGSSWIGAQLVDNYYAEGLDSDNERRVHLDTDG